MSARIEVSQSQTKDATSPRNRPLNVDLIHLLAHHIVPPKEGEIDGELAAMMAGLRPGGLNLR